MHQTPLIILCLAGYCELRAQKLSHKACQLHPLTKIEFNTLYPKSVIWTIDIRSQGRNSSRMVEITC